MFSRGRRDSRVTEAAARIAGERRVSAPRQRTRVADVFGTTPGMLQVHDQIELSARSNAPVLILGEPGTGKTLTARVIHTYSARASRPFVTVNCATLPETTVQATSKAGPTVVFEAPQIVEYVQRAAGGTLCLDEIADLGPLAQERFATLFEAHLGRGSGMNGSNLDLRVIATSSRDLHEEASTGGFRRDLLELLCSTTISLPPLRDRRADVPELAQAFVREFAREHARRVDRLSTRARELLTNYDWPENVRELRLAIERAVVVAHGPVVHHHHLPHSVQQQAQALREAPRVVLTEALNAYERELLQDALRQTRGIRSKAARLLGTTERILSYRLRKLGIDWRPFKESG